MGDIPVPPPVPQPWDEDSRPINPRYLPKSPMKHNRSRPEDPPPDLFGDALAAELEAMGFHSHEAKDKDKKKKDKDKEKKEEFFPPAAKAGTIVAYESYRFTKLDTWEKASRQRLEVPIKDLERRVKSSQARGSPIIFDQMRRMNPLRAEQINRLISHKQADNKDPYLEWAVASIAADERINKKKGTLVVPSMDIIIVKVVKTNLTPASKKDPMRPKPPGEIIDLSKPEEKKDKKDKKDKKKNKGYDEDDFLVIDDGGHHGSGGEPEIIEFTDGAGHHADIKFHDAHDLYGESPAPRRHYGRSRSRGRIPFDDPVFHDHRGSHSDDAPSVFFGSDDERSSHTTYSWEPRHNLHHRGSLRPEKSKHYRTHSRRDSFSRPRYERRYSDEYAIDIIPATSHNRRSSRHRPEPLRRRTTAYGYQPRITYHDPDIGSPVSARSFSPPLRGGGGGGPSEFDREQIRREAELKRREERIVKKEREEEVRKEVERQELLERLTRRSWRG